MRNMNLNRKSEKMVNELKKLIDQITLDIESEKRKEKLAKAAENHLAVYHTGRAQAYEAVATEINSIIRLNDTVTKKD